MRYVHPTDMDKKAAIDHLGNWLRGRQKDANGLDGPADAASNLTLQNHSATIS